MTTSGEKNLDAQLADLTRWSGGGTSIWREALRVTKSNEGRPSSLREVFIRPISNGVAASILLGCFFLIAVVMNLPHLSRSRSLENMKLTNSDSDAWKSLRARNSTPSQFMTPRTVSTPNDSQSNANLRGIGQAMYMYTIDDSGRFPLDGKQSDYSTRQIIRKVTIELKSKDVRAVFLKAQHLVRPADGEFVQDSLLAGTGREATANLTLRVRADRLSDVLNELRGMAEVTSENQEGQDVTSQMVDLDAQLRNEKRVEEEMLTLLENRKDAPLKDILELRNALKSIRFEIERLSGQQAQFTKQVSLSTVLVFIRTNDAPEPPATTFGSYLSTSLGNAWHDGVFFMFDTAATMVRIIVGGMLFWLLLLAVIGVVRRYRRRAAR